jgi:hypothetical protein
MKRMGLQSVMVATLMSLSSCGGDSAPSIALDALPPKLAGALCAAYQSCYGPIFSLFLNGDCAAITEARVRNGSFPMLAGKIAQKTIMYDGSKAQACLDSMAARSCTDLLERDSPECLAALDGTVELGGACDIDEECKGLALCKSSSGTCPGQCTALLVAGQACGEDADCQSGLQCSNETKLCVAPAGTGQACEYGSPPCGPGLLCLGKDDDKKMPGVCRSPAEAFSVSEGSACDPTAGQLCQTGLSCVPDNITLAPLSITWTCVRSGAYAAEAECKPGFPEACASGYYCSVASGALALLGGTCKPIPTAGEACGSGFGAQCQTNQVCVSGMCQSLAQNGVSCSGDAMCYSGKCGSSGGCEANLPCK